MTLRSFIRRLIPHRWNAYDRARKDIVLYTGGRVFQGPFAGMQYFAASGDWTDCAMLLGLYERELTPIVQQAINGRWARVIEVGCAQGYYAIGIALKAPSAVEVFAFEANPDALMEARRKAVANNVDARIVWKGMGDPAALDALQLSARDLLFVDIDGGERDLLNPSRSPSLANCDILVETHDFLDHGISDELKHRFHDTHAVEEIIWRPVQRAEMPYPEATDTHALCVNGRPSQTWLWMQTRSKDA